MRTHSLLPWAPVAETSFFCLFHSLLPWVLVLGRPRGWGMCESHVSNPQTVGKCCSLLNSSFPPSLPPSFPSRRPPCSLSSLDSSPGERSALCVCVHACVCARALQHTGSEQGASASGVESLLPADSFYANTKHSTRHVHIFKVKQATFSATDQETPRSSNRGTSALRFSKCLSPVFLTLPLPPKHKHWRLSYCVCVLLSLLRKQLSFSAACQKQPNSWHK